MIITDLYESEFLTDKDDIINYMQDTFKPFYKSDLKIENDGLVYHGDLALYTKSNSLKVNFKSVTGNFDCYDTGISTLRGCPQIVGINVDFGNTNLNSLKFCPVSVGNTFFCTNIKITDPKEYRFALYCEIGSEFLSTNKEINEIINEYKGAANRKHWPYAINLLSRVKL